MGVKPARAFSPDYAVPPGETVLEIIESLGIPQSELAERTGRPKKTINEIINGKAAITPETALQFERVLGVPASFWNSLEQNYRAALARIAERERLEKQTDWLTEIPVKDLVRTGWIERRESLVEQLEDVLSFFGVASVEAWRDVWGGVRNAVAFRESAVFASEFGAVAAWLRRGELEARQTRTRPFDALRFKSVLSDARKLTREEPDVFCDALASSCADAGVVVVFVRELPKLRVCGATRWLSSDRALIQLTLRYKTEDHLWFTFFHEAGHILLHGKRSIFVEEVGGTVRGDARAEASAARSIVEEEEEANRFARDLLIPPDRYRAFVQAGEFSVASIYSFADSLGISPGIVLGRLQHDAVVPYRTNLNTILKRSFRWADENDESHRPT
ncbi:HigA family addiction module antitoxin [Roseisolibacter agri]|uniref:XRE family transcriptional regulator n=1 Tax=Roseisolibacter agri TaxID=2014610 RepID=A0AA37QF85_9BACT|nr:HigA family addiction module antitoxin [Roseisolibacter agri]GLC27771.1 XRE family transcriptional regulator [Roseisolibacter agri]